MRGIHGRGLLAAAFVLAMGATSRATYDFSTTVLEGTQPGQGVATQSMTSGGTTVTLTGRSGEILDGFNSVNLSDLSVTSTTAAPATDSINMNYTLQVQVANAGVTSGLGAAGVATGTFTVTGALMGTANSTSSNIDNTYFSVAPAAQQIGNGVFSLDVGPLGMPDVFYRPGTVNGANGGLGGRIHAAVAAVPEPSAGVLVAIGGAGLLGWFARRRTGAAAA